MSLQTLLDVPDAPGGLVAAAVGPSSVALSWEDRSDNETGWVAEARSPQSGQWDEVAIGEVVAPANAPLGSTTVTTLVTGLDAEVPVAFRVRARNAAGDSQASNTSAATPQEASSGGCDDSGDAICLLDDRFQVSVQWHREDNGNTGTGKGELFPSSDRSGTFWFFNPQNIELIVKVLDGSGNNGYYWTFYGALSNVEYWITVVDTTTSDSHTYYNPPGNECGQFDTTSLAAVPQPANSSAASTTAATPIAAAAEAGSCVPSDTTVCLLDGRFKVEVDWANQHNSGATGVGHSADGPEAGEKTGYFWFFNPAEHRAGGQGAGQHRPGRQRLLLVLLRRAERRRVPRHGDRHHDRLPRAPTTTRRTTSAASSTPGPSRPTVRSRRCEQDQQHQQRQQQVEEQPRQAGEDVEAGVDRRPEVDGEVEAALQRQHQGGDAGAAHRQRPGQQQGEPGEAVPLAGAEGLGHGRQQHRQPSRGGSARVGRREQVVVDGGRQPRQHHQRRRQDEPRQAAQPAPPESPSPARRATHSRASSRTAASAIPSILVAAASAAASATRRSPSRGSVSRGSPCTPGDRSSAGSAASRARAITRSPPPARS